jgi:hypothetical protein
MGHIVGAEKLDVADQISGRLLDPPAQDTNKRYTYLSDSIDEDIMASSGILAFLADRFNVRSRELLATEGLRYLLQEYQTIRDALLDALATDLNTPGFRDEIEFISQATAADDRWVVDLEGRINKLVYISIEGKLGAPLQPSQPTGYAERLQDRGSLLFVCPSWQIRRLCEDLRQRASSSNLLARDACWQADCRTEIQWIPLTNDRRLGISSWTSLLDVIKKGAGDTSPALQSDIHQLERLVARYEHELEPWTDAELRKGGLGPTFAKALLAARVLCEIISAQLGTSIRSSWTTTRSQARASQDFLDWYGGKVWLPDSVGGDMFAVSFDPLLWGQDGASSPLRLSFRARELPTEASERLYAVYVQMLERANDLFRRIFDATPFPAGESSEDWWMVPFPISPELAGEEARDDMTRTTAVLLTPLLNLIRPESDAEEPPTDE